MAFKLSATISSGVGRDGSAGSGGRGIGAANGKLDTAGSGGSGIVASADTSGRIDVSVSGGGGESIARCVEGNVGFAGSGGGGSATAVGGPRKTKVSFVCWDTYREPRAFL